MNRDTSDVIVIGAGPYGLSSAAALAAAGARVRVFGEVMSFWKKHMPRGMLLRSPWAASHIGDPASPLSLDEFERVRGSKIERPIPLSDFITYGEWVREHGVPEIDGREVRRVEAVDDGFRLILDDGEPVRSERVIVAAGIRAFASRPKEFAHLPPELASHSNENADLERFRGKRVAVVGGGQSALESAVLLSESGAEVEVLMRAPRLRWVGRAPRDGFVGRLLFDRTDVGPAVVSQIVARPMLVRRLPSQAHSYVTSRSLRAGCALWLGPRMSAITITTGRRVEAATPSNGHVHLRLDDGMTREVDHVLLGTGYKIDVARYEFLDRELVRKLRTVEGQPVLSPAFESSVRGLHFAGAPAVLSFGPLLRFVAGTSFASAALVRSIVRGSPAHDARIRAKAGISSERRVS